MKKIIAIGGDAHSDVVSVERSVEKLKEVKRGANIFGIYRGGDDGADPRFRPYFGLKLKPLAKQAREEGFKDAARYGRILEIFREGFGNEEKFSSHVRFCDEVDSWANQIGVNLDSCGVPVRMIPGNADGFQDMIRWIHRFDFAKAIKKCENSATAGFLAEVYDDSKFSADEIFNVLSNIVYSPEVCVDMVPPNGIIPYTPKPIADVAVISIPYSFGEDVEASMNKAVGREVEYSGRELVEKSLEKALEQLNDIKPSMIIQVQHEPPVQSLVTMLDPRNRPLEAGSVYQKAIEAITDINPAEHLIFYGHVGNPCFAQAVPHELKDRKIRTFHWPEEGHGGMLYLNLGSGEVREEKYM